MAYRGEDVPGTHGDWGRQTPWQPSSGAAPGSTGAWDGGSRDYAGDENYPPRDGGGFGYGPDGSYPGPGPQGYGPQDGQYGDPYGQQPYEQQPYEQYNGYGQGQGGAGSSGTGTSGTSPPGSQPNQPPSTRPPGSAQQPPGQMGGTIPNPSEAEHWLNALEEERKSARRQERTGSPRETKDKDW